MWCLSPPPQFTFPYVEDGRESNTVYLPFSKVGDSSGKSWLYCTTGAVDFSHSCDTCSYSRTKKQHLVLINRIITPPPSSWSSYISWGREGGIIIPYCRSGNALLAIQNFFSGVKTCRLSPSFFLPKKKRERKLTSSSSQVSLSSRSLIAGRWSRRFPPFLPPQKCY